LEASSRVVRNTLRSDASRERVLHAALRAIAVNGFQGSTLAAIAADADLTTAGLLHHFPSKEQLLVAVLAERDRLDGARFQLASFRGLAALDRLAELVQHNTMVPGLVQAYTVLMGESVGEDHPARAWFRDRYPRRQANIAAAIRAGIEMGEVRPDVDCDALAAEIIAMMDGLQVQWVLNPDQVDMAAVFADYIAGVRRSVRVEPDWGEPDAKAAAGLLTKPRG
jgi:AcrR family transcriptional regulator